MRITKNMGTADRIIRSLLAITFLLLYINGVTTGTIGIVLVVVSLVFLGTSLISFCPLYTILGISTKKE